MWHQKKPDIRYNFKRAQNSIVVETCLHSTFCVCFEIIFDANTIQHFRSSLHSYCFSAGSNRLSAPPEMNQGVKIVDESHQWSDAGMEVRKSICVMKYYIVYILITDIYSSFVCSNCKISGCSYNAGLICCRFYWTRPISSWSVFLDYRDLESQQFCLSLLEIIHQTTTGIKQNCYLLKMRKH